jgi:excisionase family DNA binding protein
MERLLTVEDAADQLGTSVRFVRRLIFERRIAFVKVGRHVRIASADLDAYIRAGRVEAGAIPILARRRGA